MFFPKSLLLFFSFLISVINAQEHADAKLIFLDREKEICNEIKKIPQDGSVLLETPFFSSDTVAKALIEAARKGAQVVIHTTSRRGKNKQNTDLKLTSAGCTVEEFSDLHAKRVLLQPDRNSVKKSIVFLGSDNLTNLSLFHKEAVVKVVDNEDYYRENADYFNNSKKKNGSKKVIQTTPEGQCRVFGSQDNNLIASKVMRVKKVLFSPDSSNRVDIASMTFDSHEIVDAVVDIFKNCPADKYPMVRFFLDRSAVKHTDLLKRLKAASATNVSIHIYNEKGDVKIFDKYPTIQHRKLIARRCAGHYLAIISTGNLTKKSDSEVNYDSYHIDDEELCDAIFKLNDELATECINYDSMSELQSNSDKENVTKEN